MRKLIDDRIVPLLAVLLSLASSVTLVPFFWPGFVPFLLRHPAPGWIIVMILFAALSVYWAWSGREISKFRSAIADAQAEVSGAPTPRDVELFNAILDSLPMTRGPMAYLDSGAFSAKSWRGDRIAPLYKLEYLWEHEYFDDVVVRQGFVQFKECLKEFLEWLSGNGSPHHNFSEQEPIYNIPDGDERRRSGTGGWPEFDAARKEGMSRCRSFAASRISLERAGRLRGL